MFKVSKMEAVPSKEEESHKEEDEELKAKKEFNRQMEVLLFRFCLYCSDALSFMLLLCLC